MQFYPLVSNNNKRLLLYALGWASTPAAVAHIEVPNYDVSCLFDYRDFAPLPAEKFCQYQEIVLVAWSFGVWISEQIMREIPLARAFAFNGTPVPVNEKFGMHPRLVELTIRGVEKQGISAFETKAYGGKDKAPRASNFIQRSPEELALELRNLSTGALKDSSEHIQWTQAYISENDAIFPSKSMQNYWQTRHLGETISTPHYPFEDPKILLNALA